MVKIKIRFQKWFHNLILKKDIKSFNEDRLHIIFSILFFIKCEMVSFHNNKDHKGELKEYKNYISINIFGLNVLHFKFYTNTQLTVMVGNISIDTRFIE